MRAPVYFPNTCVLINSLSLLSTLKFKCQLTATLTGMCQRKIKILTATLSAMCQSCPDLLLTSATCVVNMYNRCIYQTKLSIAAKMIN